MRCILISDTHGQEAWLDLPSGDILIHCGDFGLNSIADLEYTNRWFSKQDFKYKIFVAGNHDFACYRLQKHLVKGYLKDIIYLQDDLIEIEGLRIYGSPWTPKFNDWAFMLNRNSFELKRIWQKIPENLDFLITHCPPVSILDRNTYNNPCGCELLYQEVLYKMPKYHVFGHIHESYGKWQDYRGGTKFVNCSLLNKFYHLTNKPIILDI